MVRAWDATSRDKLAGKFAEAPLHSVANDRIADLLRDCETDTQQMVPVIAFADQQDKSGHGKASAAVGGEEIRAFAQDC